MDYYYDNYYGHSLTDLETLLASYRRTWTGNSVIYLVGDSILDNKYWVKGTKVPPPIIHVPHMKTAVPDVAYWVNHHLEGIGAPLMCLNCAVEETTLNEKLTGLSPQDIFVRDHLRTTDSLVISVGGNDIALKPSYRTIAHMTSLLATPGSLLHKNPSFGYFVNYFVTGIRKYVEKLTKYVRPQHVIVVFPYFPSLTGTGWADTALMLMGYGQWPGRLQLIMRSIYDAVTQELIGTTGTGLTVLPLYDIFDPRIEKDYVARVEPSASGGKKIAAAIVRITCPPVPEGEVVTPPQGPKVDQKVDQKVNY